MALFPSDPISRPAVFAGLVAIGVGFWFVQRSAAKASDARAVSAYRLGRVDAITDPLGNPSDADVVKRLGAHSDLGALRYGDGS